MVLWLLVEVSAIASLYAEFAAFSLSQNGFFGMTNPIIGLILATIGGIISHLPYANKLPMVFWVSLVGVIASLPIMPGQEWIIAKTSQVTFLATTTPVLAYAGLSLGKDLAAFRRLSWRIIPVALAVTAGTFICASALAQIMLHLEGLI